MRTAMKRRQGSQGGGAEDEALSGETCSWQEEQMAGGEQVAARGCGWRTKGGGQ